jgi:hypothetical protein
MKRIITAAALMLVACASYAEGDVKFVTGVAAAFSDYKGDSSFPVDDSGLGLQLYGQVRANSWLALEVGYYNSGDFSSDFVNVPGLDDGTYDISLSGFNLSALGYLPVFQNSESGLQLYGKLGLYDYDINLTVPAGNSQLPGSLGHESGIFGGAGIIMNVSENIGIRTEVVYYDISNADLWSLNMGVEIEF